MEGGSRSRSRDRGGFESQCKDAKLFVGGEVNEGATRISTQLATAVANWKLTKQPSNTESELLFRHLSVYLVMIATIFCRNGRVSDASMRLIKQGFETICICNNHVLCKSL
jgi:hypothetical protein